MTLGKKFSSCMIPLFNHSIEKELCIVEKMSKKYEVRCVYSKRRHFPHKNSSDCEVGLFVL